MFLIFLNKAKQNYKLPEGRSYMVYSLISHTAQHGHTRSVEWSYLVRTLDRNQITTEAFRKSSHHYFVIHV